MLEVWFAPEGDGEHACASVRYNGKYVHFRVGNIGVLAAEESARQQWLEYASDTARHEIGDV